jgi:hypothetical protein
VTHAAPQLRAPAEHERRQPHEANTYDNKGVNQDSQILEGKASGPLPVPQGTYQSSSDIPSLQQISELDYPHFDTSIPDRYRIDVWLQSFKQAEQTGNLANLNLFTLGDDHTSGVTPVIPTPAAQNADNDLAVGRLVDTISHSKFWSSSAIFIVEDDPQAGVDHVDGHRSLLELISPYAKQGVVNSTYYTQINVVKTIEQILGIAPMNQEDRAAEPIVDAFTNRPDLTPYDALPNQIPADPGARRDHRLGDGALPAQADRSPRDADLDDPDGAAGDARHLPSMGVVERSPGLRQARPGQPGPTQPCRLVQRDGLDAALPGREDHPPARPCPRPQPAVGRHRRRLNSASNRHRVHVSSHGE